MGNLKIDNRELYHLLSMPYYDLESDDRPKTDWNIKSLIAYTIRVIRYITQQYPESNIVLMGHSLGGSIGVKTIDLINQSEDMKSLKDRIEGVIVIDVVEGTALAALPHMHFIVKNK